METATSLPRRSQTELRTMGVSRSQCSSRSKVASRVSQQTELNDSRPMYEALATAGATNLRVVIPPMKTATVDSRATGVWRQRNQAIERIGEVGRRQWRKESGAHQQAAAENAMYRYKRIIGDRLRAQHPDAQKTEALIAVIILNRMTTLGMPESAKIVA